MDGSTPTRGGRVRRRTWHPVRVRGGSAPERRRRADRIGRDEMVVEMPQGHEQWESLAVNHVLGGLDQSSASAFRRHLVGCLQCKAQVAELRDLAGSLEDAARDERAVLALQTRARREVTTDDEVPEAQPPQLPWRVLVALGVVVLALVGLVSHNLHLQSREAALEDQSQRQRDVLSGLGSGLVMDTAFSEGTSGIVVADGDRVSWTISNLPVPATDQRLVVWLLHPDEAASRVTMDAGDMPDGEVIGSADDDGLHDLVVTMEQVGSDGIPDTPTGTQYVESDLTQVRRGGPNADPDAVGVAPGAASGTQRGAAAD